MDALYRVSQLWRNLTARRLSRSEVREIGVDLNRAELALFLQMSASDQQHALRVYRLLRAIGQTDKKLLCAALLHDVGKISTKLTVWDRSLAVLGKALVPRKAREWGMSDRAGWKRAFVVREQHAAWGADLAKRAGSPVDVVELILRHQDTLAASIDQMDARLMLLQWADDQN